MKVYALIHCNQLDRVPYYPPKRAVLGIYTDPDVAYNFGNTMCDDATARDDIFIYDIVALELDADPVETTYFSGEYCRQKHRELSDYNKKNVTSAAARTAPDDETTDAEVEDVDVRD